MRKTEKTLFVIVCTLLFCIGFNYSQVNAQQFFYDNEWHEHNEKINLIVKGETVIPDVPPIIINGRTLAPARAIFEEMGADVSWDGERNAITILLGYTEVTVLPNSNIAEINGQEEEMDAVVKTVNDRTLVPVRFIAQKLGMLVDWRETDSSVIINYQKGMEPEERVARLIDVKTEFSDGNITVALKFDAEFTNYEVTESENKIQLELFNCFMMAIDGTQYVDRGILKSITSVQANYYPNIARVTFMLNGASQYTVKNSGDSIYIMFMQKGSVVNKITHIYDDVSETVEIFMQNPKLPEVFRLSDPERIVADFEASTLKNTTSSVINSSYVKTIRSAQHDDGRVRVVLDMSMLADMIVVEGTESIKIIISKPQINNISYDNSGSITFTLNDGGQTAASFKESVDAAQKKYSITVSGSNFGEGVMEINDMVVNKLEVIKNNGNTTLSFYTKKTCNFYIKEVNNTTRITITPVESSSVTTTTDALSEKAKTKLIVIDPGHGGTEIGASWEENGVTVIREKDLNLDIALRVNELLKKAGAKVVMTRTDDSTVDLYKRSAFANELDADLFLSIHNNSFDDTSAQGVEVLYYPGDYPAKYNMSSERYAEIVQKELVKYTGMKDRGLKSSPKISVLRNSQMPAILTESGFITNKADRDKLLSNEYRQKIAEAIYIGTIKTLNEMTQ